MREVGDLFIGATAIGDVVDDVDDVMRFAGLILDQDALRRDELLTQCLALPLMLVLKKSGLRLQGSFVVSHNAVSGGLRENIDSRLDDNLFPPQAEPGLGDAIGQKVATVARALHRDLRGYVVDDLKKESVIPIALSLQFPTLGDVFHCRNPAALRQGPVDDLDGTTVSGYEDALGDFAASDVFQHVGAELVDIALE